MDLLLDWLFNLDEKLRYLAESHEHLVLILLFSIVFLETGLVVTPFLPGDSLIFVVGTLAGIGVLDLYVVNVVLIVAAILGDSLNYYLGKLFGDRFFSEDARFLKLSYLRYTEDFYRRHGGKTIVIARFVPIVRTFAPFVAGMGRMQYKRFMTYNVLGAIFWVTSLSILGYLLGRSDWVKDNFSIVIFAIIMVSLIPVIFQGIQEYKRRDLNKLK